MASTEFYKIRERTIDRLYVSKWTRGVNDSGSTTTIVDAAAGFSGATADTFDFAWIKIRSDAAGAAPQGEVRQMSEGGYTASTGTFTVSPAFSAATAVSDTYEVHYKYHPDTLDRIINSYLRNLYVPSLYPLSLDLVASDNNTFEEDIATNLITGWTRNGTDVTAANETTIIYNGTRSAKLTQVVSATADYYSRQFSVNYGKSYYTAATAACDSGDTARLRVIDVTNSNATIEDASTTQQNMQELIIPWSAPSGCRTAEVRLLGAAVGDVTYWDDYQTWAVGQHSYQLPTWVTRPEQVIRLIAFPQGVGGPSSDYDYRANERRANDLSWQWQRYDLRATNELWVNVWSQGNARPYIEAYKPLSEVTADYSGSPATTAVTVPLSSSEADLVVEGVLGELEEQIARASVGEVAANHRRQARVHMERYRSGLRHLMPDWGAKRQVSGRVGAVMG